MKSLNSIAYLAGATLEYLFRLQSSAVCSTFILCAAVTLQSLVQKTTTIGNSQFFIQNHLTASSLNLNSMQKFSGASCLNISPLLRETSLSATSMSSKEYGPDLDRPWRAEDLHVLFFKRHHLGWASNARKY